MAAVVLTHAHFDHMGFAERARRELGVAVYVHENDVTAATGARTVLVGHGEPWTGGAEAAVTAARAAGVA